MAKTIPSVAPVIDAGGADVCLHRATRTIARPMFDDRLPTLVLTGNRNFSTRQVRSRFEPLRGDGSARGNNLPDAVRSSPGRLGRAFPRKGSTNK